jgi:glycosyltransferase involved in cell wall biosynthesis
MIKEKISVVIAAYNEYNNLIPLYERLSNVLKKTTKNYEIIFSDNGSTDKSGEIFKSLIKKDKNVVIVKLSRNFNASQGAFAAGMSVATGDCVINMDGDGEDPPEVIPRFVEKWKEGYDIVYGVRRKRQVSLFRKLAYRAFYRVFKKIAYINIPVDAGEFALIDRKVVDEINNLPEKDRFLRALRAWVGFRSIGVIHDRGKRIHGETTNSLMGNVKWAMKAIFSFSYFPLTLISYMSFVVFCLSLLGILFYFISYFFIADPPEGIATIIVLVLFMGSIQLLALSIIGQYIAKIFQEVKGRPTFIIEKVLKNKSSK